MRNISVNNIAVKYTANAAASVTKGISTAKTSTASKATVTTKTSSAVKATITNAMETSKKSTITSTKSNISSVIGVGVGAAAVVGAKGAVNTTNNNAGSVTSTVGSAAVYAATGTVNTTNNNAGSVTSTVGSAAVYAATGLPTGGSSSNVHLESTKPTSGSSQYNPILISTSSSNIIQFSPSSQEKWFKFTPGNPGTYDINCTGGRVGVTLYDDHLSQIATDNNAKSNNDSKILKSLKNDRAYYLKLSGSDSTCLTVRSNVDTISNFTNGGSWTPKDQTFDPDGISYTPLKKTFLTPQQAASYMVSLDKDFVRNLRDGTFKAINTAAVTYAIGAASASSTLVKQAVSKFSESAIVSTALSFLSGCGINASLPTITEMEQDAIKNKTHNFENGLIINSCAYGIPSNPANAFESWYNGTSFIACGEPRYSGTFKSGDIQTLWK